MEIRGWDKQNSDNGFFMVSMYQILSLSFYIIFLFVCRLWTLVLHFFSSFPLNYCITMTFWHILRFWFSTILEYFAKHLFAICYWHLVEKLRNSEWNCPYECFSPPSTGTQGPFRIRREFDHVNPDQKHVQRRRLHRVLLLRRHMPNGLHVQK